MVDENENCEAAQEIMSRKSGSNTEKVTDSHYFLKLILGTTSAIAVLIALMGLPATLLHFHRLCIPTHFLSYDRILRSGIPPTVLVSLSVLWWLGLKRQLRTVEMSEKKSLTLLHSVLLLFLPFFIAILIIFVSGLLAYILLILWAISWVVMKLGIGWLITTFTGVELANRHILYFGGSSIFIVVVLISIVKKINKVRKFGKGKKSAANSQFEDTEIPISDESSDEIDLEEPVRFKIKLEFQNELDNCHISNELQREFINNRYILDSKTHSISIEKKGNIWLIDTRHIRGDYIIVKSGDKLEVRSKKRRSHWLDVEFLLYKIQTADRLREKAMSLGFLVLLSFAGISLATAFLLLIIKLMMLILYLDIPNILEYRSVLIISLACGIVYAFLMLFTSFVEFLENMIMSKDELKKRRGKIITLVAVSIVCLALIGVYSNWLYPIIPHGLGGGRPQPIALWFNEADFPTELLKEMLPNSRLGNIEKDSEEAVKDSEEAVLVRCDSIYLIYASSEILIISDSNNARSCSGAVIEREKVEAVSWGNTSEERKLF
ncbi:hypothetical protein ACFL6S_31780 [Candidatus Poribacteria bacterium]